MIAAAGTNERLFPKWGGSTPNKMRAIRPSGEDCTQILGERTIYETGFYLSKSTGSPQSDDGAAASTAGAPP